MSGEGADGLDTGIMNDIRSSVLVNAVNEQKAIVDSQKEEIKYLKSELLEMKEMMKELLNK
jgi:hypothetical protein